MIRITDMHKEVSTGGNDGACGQFLVHSSAGNTLGPGSRPGRCGVVFEVQQ